MIHPITAALILSAWFLAGIGIGLLAWGRARRDAAHFNDPWSNLND